VISHACVLIDRAELQAGPQGLPSRKVHELAKSAMSMVWVAAKAQALHLQQRLWSAIRLEAGAPEIRTYRRVGSVCAINCTARPKDLMNSPTMGPVRDTRQASIGFTRAPGRADRLSCPATTWNSSPAQRQGPRHTSRPMT
jgi:hypothetical protein